MALKDKVKSLVKKGFESLKDLKITVTYTRLVPGTYDPATDTTADVVTNYTLDVVNAALSEQEVSWFPASNVTQKLVIASADLPVIPQDDDQVTIDGSVWQVKRVRRVPGDSVYVVYIQEP